ncbi:pilus assembly PilX family protein [Methylibium sp.]|uniref:pilus assembly PilX family protein n=1 Tax=Methylibium sp. TaxID=2067992 RepID=UPI003D143004
MRPSAARQRGAAALAVAMILLLAMTIMAAFENRGLVFEQRTSANQYRSTRAFELAEAGLEWAQALLNEGRHLDARCRPTEGQPTSFRDRYAPMSADLGFVPVTTLRPGCSLGAEGLSCSCPAPGGPTALEGDDPSFTIEFAAVPGDPQSLRLTVRGCSSRGTQCVPGSGPGPSDATAVAQIVLKLRPALRTLPVAALTAGGSATLDGWQLANLDHATHGLAIDAGGDIVVTGNGALTTLPGSPVENALVKHDEALAGLASADATGDAFFAALFGSDTARFASAATTRRLSGCTAVSCGTAMLSAHAEGHTTFFVDGDLQLDAAGWPDGSVGSADRPLIVIVAGQLRFNGSFPAYGLLYAQAADFSPGGDIDLQGALVARGSMAGSAAGRVMYSPEVLQRLRIGNGLLARVPGSWRDGRCAGNDPMQACSFNP